MKFYIYLLYISVSPIILIKTPNIVLLLLKFIFVKLNRKLSIFFYSSEEIMISIIDPFLPNVFINEVSCINI